MKILLTGATGFLGAHIMGALRSEHNLLTPEGILDEQFVDLTIESNVEKLTEHSYDAIIHLAAYMASPDTIEDLTVLEVNNRISHSLGILARKTAVKHLIHISSIAVYPNVDGIVDESGQINMSTNNDCFYGLSKFSAEQIIEFMLRRSSTRVVHLRLGIVHGPGMRQDRIQPVMLKELQDNGCIEVYGMGKRNLPLVHVDYVVKAVAVALKSDISGPINVVEENISTRELAECIAQDNGFGTEVVKLVDKGSVQGITVDGNQMKNLIRKWDI